MALPPPPVTSRQRGSSFRLSDLALLQRLFPEVATRFYPGAQESLAAFSSKPFGFNTGRHLERTAACCSTLPGVTATFADPVLVIETRKPRDTEGYTAELFFRQTFLCFIFR